MSWAGKVQRAKAGRRKQPAAQGLQAHRAGEEERHWEPAVPMAWYKRLLRDQKKQGYKDRQGPDLGGLRKPGSV